MNSDLTDDELQALLRSQQKAFRADMSPSRTVREDHHTAALQVIDRARAGMAVAPYLMQNSIEVIVVGPRSWPSITLAAIVKVNDVKRGAGGLNPQPAD